MKESLTQKIRKIEYAKDVLSDLEEVWFHISEDSEHYANKVILEINKKFEYLLKFPQTGKMRNELFLGLRSFPSGKYLIFYQETDFGIEIVRVIHGARDIEQAFEEMIPGK